MGLPTSAAVVSGYTKCTDLDISDLLHCCVFPGSQFLLISTCVEWYLSTLSTSSNIHSRVEEHLNFCGRQCLVSSSQYQYLSISFQIALFVGLMFSTNIKYLAVVAALEGHGVSVWLIISVLFFCHGYGVEFN